MSKVYKIYSVTSPEIDGVYIGYTQQLLSKRKAFLKKQCDDWLNDKGIVRYNPVFCLTMTDNFKLVLIEKITKKGKEEIEKRVNYWIKQTENCNDKDMSWHLMQL